MVQVKETEGDAEMLRLSASLGQSAHIQQAFNELSDWAEPG